MSLSRIVLHALSALVLLAPALANAQAATAYVCGGDVEKQTWKLWDDQARAMLAKTYIEDRLKPQGDSYALYDLQVVSHNLVAMAARCGRDDRLRELASLMKSAYQTLENVPGSSGLAWICRGGRVCKDSSPLKNTEVSLNSAQFLAVAMRLASALAPQAARDDQAREYVGMTVMVAMHHLNRWVNDPRSRPTGERLKATPTMARDGQSRYFFTDMDLWTLAIHAELAGIAQIDAPLRGAITRELTPEASENLSAMLQLLRSRLTLSTVPMKRLGSGAVVVADIDRGFWSRYGDNRYAGYTGETPPVVCGKAGEPARVNVNPASVAPVESGGWDLSHARRLVHVTEALDRNAKAMIALHRLPSGAVPTGLAEAFSAALIERVWNGDAKRPLFANYWDGSNGWYRAAYSTTGNCIAGYAPSELSDAFILGGFLTWGGHRPRVAELGRTLHRVVGSKDPEDQKFTQRYYSGFGSAASARTLTLSRLQFWPSLVQTAR